MRRFHYVGPPEGTGRQAWDGIYVECFNVSRSIGSFVRIPLLLKWRNSIVVATPPDEQIKTSGFLFTFAINDRGETSSKTIWFL